jgi:hypothetical protein
MEFLFHVLGCVCYTLGSVYYTIALVILVRKNRQ